MVTLLLSTKVDFLLVLPPFPVSDRVESTGSTIATARHNARAGLFYPSSSTICRLVFRHFINAYYTRRVVFPKQPQR